MKILNTILFSGALLVFSNNQSVAYQAPVNDSILLYASFDKHTDKADYANATDHFGGGGYKLTKGYKGNAIDLRNHGLATNFWETSTGFLPHMTQWLLWPRGNFDFRQGALEFWLSGTDNSEVELFGFQSNQPLRPRLVDGKMVHTQPYVRISNFRMRWLLVSLKGEIIEGKIDFLKIPGFNKRLVANQWNHFTLQWSPEGVNIYLDGRIVYAKALENDGLAFVPQANRAITMNGVIIDELKIWDNPRYKESFEPEWTNNSRPKNAFPGVEGVKPVLAKSHLRNRPLAVTQQVGTSIKTTNLGEWELNLDTKTGYLTSISNQKIPKNSAVHTGGLQIWSGYDRSSLNAPKIIGSINSTKDKISFKQEWIKGFTTENTITLGQQNEIVWDVEFANNSKNKLLLEALLSVPVSIKQQEFFDMSWTHTDLQNPRRRDEYIHSLPLVAISDGKVSLGVGFNPSQSLSALIGEWNPALATKSAFIRQGSRVVLDKAEKQKISYVIVQSEGAFGTKDAIAAYQDLYPDLFKQRKETSIYSYMGVSQHFRYVYVPDLTRQYYTGNQWGHMSYHTKGDFNGRERFWGREDLKDDISYAHAKRNEQIHKTIGNMRNAYLDRNKESYESFYTPIRTHDLPNSTAAFIAREVMPDTEFTDDPLVTGQYYLPKNIYVNEYKTPIGEMLKEDVKTMLESVGKYTPGMINDLSQWSPIRFNDEYARKSPGRSFAIERGEFLVGAVGSVERYKEINKYPVNGKVRSMWSDYGGVSYSLSAYSAAHGIESGEWFYSLGGLQIGLEMGRNLLGEKPMSLLTSYGLDDLGRRFKPTDFTSERLRDYYRFGFRRIMLGALRAGYYVDPPMLHGKLWNSETNPILVESLINGRRTIPAAKVKDELWVVRGGSLGKDMIAIGNSTPNLQSTFVHIFSEYNDGGKPYLWAPFYGGKLSQVINKEYVALQDVKVDAHNVQAIKPVAQLVSGEVSNAVANWSGDGLTINIEVTLNAKSAGALSFVLPTEYYTLTSVNVDGKTVSTASQISFTAGSHTIKAVLKNTVLQFDATVWNKVKLIENSKANFCLISGISNYEAGTANQLNLFLQQFDEEDGIEGNLTPTTSYSSLQGVPANYTGWKVDFLADKSAQNVAVTIDEGKKIIKVKGNSPGQVRRATMLFMRLMDRTYPTIGRFVPLPVNLERGWNKTKEPRDVLQVLYGGRRSQTYDFFKEFADKDFLFKPILEKNQEELYKDGNKNFEGKYIVRTSPYLFEPTFKESYIYDQE